MKQKKLIVMCNDETVGDLLKFALNFELPAGEVPTEVMLVPPGTVVKGRDGREYLNNDPAAIISWFANREVDLTFDWLHATELKAPKGDEAPASGWGKFGTMAAKADGSIWINVEWTPRGAEAIKNREYRYISPVYLCDATMAIRGISSVGLTNKPNVFIPALNGEQTPSHSTTGGSMDFAAFLAAIAALCGLPATATPEEVVNACKEMQGKMTTAMNFEKNPPPLTLFVPRADFDSLMTRCTNAEKAITAAATEQLKKEANTEIEAALAAKKITPGTRSYYEKQCNTEAGLQEFRDFAKAAPVIAGDSNLDTKKPGEGDGLQLNAEAKQMADIFGNSPEDLKKYGAA